ncbi:MAG: hypothetical protein K2H30_04245, partial [Clostridia bacterium]|nr:hypothetical protein [Clostridia bacterium]
MPKYANAATTPLKNEKDKYLGSLTLSNYDSTTNKVFDAGVLADLYAALTGVEGATLQRVADDLVGTMSEAYGYNNPLYPAYDATTYLPTYKTAADIYALNDNHNITVRLNGQEFAVSFLTTDKNGHVIATLWMTQPLVDGGITVTGKLGWATAAYNTNYTTSIGESYTSHAYSTSMVRMKVLNAGPTDGTATAYAMGTSNANVTSLNQSVDSETRKGNVLAPFTLENSALIGTGYANQSLIGYLVQPSQVEYTYWLSYPYAGGNGANTSYFLNEALTSPMKLPTVANANTEFYASGKGTHQGYWWNQGVLNYATSTENHYNDWGSDYIWIPSLSETGYSAIGGLWGTGLTTTGQIRFGDEQKSDSSTLAGSTDSTERVWLRSSYTSNPDSVRVLSSSGTSPGCLTAATLAVRPALHLDLTAADESAVLNKPTADNTQFVYDSMEKKYTPNGYNSNAMDITGNVQTNANEDGYTVSVSPKNGYTWTDGTTTAVSFTFIIKKANSEVTPKLSDEMTGLYNSMTVEDIILAVDPTKNPKPANGIFKWTCDTTQYIKNGAVYSWEFIPADEYIDNYNTTTGEYTAAGVTTDVLDRIEVAKNDNFADKEFYTTNLYSQLKSYITVTAIYQSGVQHKVLEYGFGPLVNGIGALDELNLPAGDNVSVTVSYDTKSATFTIPKVTEVTVESVELTFQQLNAKVYPYNTLEDLTTLSGAVLVVSAKYNNLNTETVTDFELKLVDGTAFKVGANEFYAVYGGVESNTATVNVSKAVYDTSDLKFEDKLAPYTGEKFDTTGWVTGLPAGVTVTYSCETDMTQIGKHVVTAHFSGDEENYEAIPDMTATLTIENNYALPEIVNDTLFYNPEGNTFE